MTDVSPGAPARTRQWLDDELSKDIAALRRTIGWVPMYVIVVALIGIMFVLFTNASRRNIEQIRRLRDESVAVRHTLEVQRSLDALMVHLMECDSTARGVMLLAAPPLRNSAALQAQTDVLKGIWDACRSKSLAQLSHAAELTIDNAVQQAHLKELDALTTQRLDLLETTMRQRDADGLQIAVDTALRARGPQIQAGIRTHVDAMIAEENRLLSNRRDQAQDAFIEAIRGRLGSSLMSGLLLVGVGALVLSQAHASQRRERALVSAYTEAVKAHSEAEHANVLKDQFLAVVSHELRTPLNAVLGYAQIASQLSEGAATPALARALQAIRRNADVQLRLVNDILDTTHIMTGNFTLKKDAVDLVPIILASCESVRPMADHKALVLHCKVQGPVFVLADGERMQQVFFNLMNNSVKFTPPGGRIDVTLEQRVHTVQIVIADTGAGFPPHLGAHIFERFRQGDSSTTRAHGGMGLGLAIAKHIVTGHGGTITAESAGPGTGATFTVSLPLEPLDA